MTKEQALAIVKQVCSIYRGTFEEHTNIQKALEILEDKKEDKK